MPLYLGIDGGGTKTEAVLLSNNLVELGRGYGGPCNIHVQPLEVLGRSIRDAVSALLPLVPSAETLHVCAAVAGFSNPQRREDFSEILRRECRTLSVSIQPDYLAAYWGAGEGADGIAVSAGTGAVACGRMCGSEPVRVGGRGFILGDEGSGAWIGLQALRGLLHRMEMGLPAALGDDALLRHLHASSPEEIVLWVHRAPESDRLAALAPMVMAAADRGCSASSALLHAAGCQLGSLAQRCAKRLNADTSWTVWPVGGLFRCAQIRAAFREVVEQAGGVPADAKHGAAIGAARMAFEAATDLRG
jgi:N-acetylglucosamine kinase-like BadF-type ATPase